MKQSNNNKKEFNPLFTPLFFFVWIIVFIIVIIMVCNEMKL
jgi:hypothetical protein